MNQHCLEICICCVLTLVDNAAQNIEVKRPLLDKVIHGLTLIEIYISCISSFVENGAQSFGAKTIATC